MTMDYKGNFHPWSFTLKQTKFVQKKVNELQKTFSLISTIPGNKQTNLSYPVASESPFTDTKGSFCP